jgi:D-lactate dehydrogenase
MRRMSERPEVFFYEAFAEEEAVLRRLLPAEIRAGFTAKTIQEAGDTEPPAPVISVRTQSVLPLAWRGSLRAILSRSTGYDHLVRYLEAGDAAAPRPAAGYLPLYCNRAVAEQALLLWMALMRRLPLQIERFRTFSRDGLTGRECTGKTLVVVGVGNIGSEVVKIGAGLEMTVLGVDIVQRHDFVDYVAIDAALPRADVVVSAMNLTAENRGYFDTRRLLQMPRGAIFVNVARGELSPSSGLLSAVEDGHLGGVGLDVYDQESALAVALRGGHESDDPEVQATLALARHSNVILTPHNAFNSEEAVERKAQQSVEQLSALRERGAFTWPAPPADAP